VGWPQRLRRAMPSADFCPTVRLPFDSPSRRSDTVEIPGVSSAAFCAQPPDLRFAPSMDTDFAVSCPLVQRPRLISGSCPSTRTFDPCFLQTPPRDGGSCIITSPYLHQVGQRPFTSKLLSMPSTQRGRWRGGCFAYEKGSSVRAETALLCSAHRSVASWPCSAGPDHRHGEIPLETHYGSTETLFKIHTSCVRRKRQRLPSNGSIRTDAADLTSTAPAGLCAASLPIET
jgi:hypothetical protein